MKMKIEKKRNDECKNLKSPPKKRKEDEKELKARKEKKID